MIFSITTCIMTLSTTALSIATQYDTNTQLQSLKGGSHGGGGWGWGDSVTSVPWKTVSLFQNFLVDVSRKKIRPRWNILRSIFLFISIDYV